MQTRDIVAVTRGARDPDALRTLAEAKLTEIDDPSAGWS